MALHHAQLCLLIGRSQFSLFVKQRVESSNRPSDASTCSSPLDQPLASPQSFFMNQMTIFHVSLGIALACNFSFQELGETSVRTRFRSPKLISFFGHRFERIDLNPSTWTSGHPCSTLTRASQSNRFTTLRRGGCSKGILPKMSVRRQPTFRTISKIVFGVSGFGDF